MRGGVGDDLHDRGDQLHRRLRQGGTQRTYLARFIGQLGHDCPRNVGGVGSLPTVLTGFTVRPAVIHQLDQLRHPVRGNAHVCK